VSHTLTEQQWSDYQRDGFLHLGPLVSDAELTGLRDRADDLALGRLTRPEVRFQRDTGGRYEDLPDETNDAASTLLYRKVQGLEHDELYRPLLQHPVFREIAARHYGPHASVSLFRAMIMNKPAGQGTVLPWHQDGGDVWALDRDPLVTTWVALDAATVENGCVEVIPGSHRLGLVTSEGSTLSPEDAARFCPAHQVRPLEVPAGHGLLMHNWLLHRSGTNPTSAPRRAFTACYLDGRTRSTLTGSPYPMVFGEPPSTPAWVPVLLAERDAHLATAAAAQEYAVSLRDDNERTHASLATATDYARSLEVEVARLKAAQTIVPEQRSVGRVAGALKRGRVLLRDRRPHL
jgi:hypothetical protein